MSAGLTIMKMQAMVMKMLAMATTVWSAEMARAMEVAVYAASMTVNRKRKKASAVGLKPEHTEQTCITQESKGSQSGGRGPRVGKRMRRGGEDQELKTGTRRKLNHS